jgi:hypothetical protein
MALSPLAIHNVTTDLLACVCQALNDAAGTVEDQPGCPCRACVVPGQPAWDSCEDPCTGEAGGQLSVSVVRLYGSTLDQFPVEVRAVQGVKGCPPLLTAVDLLVTVLRCAPTMDEGGCPPSCEDLADAARVLHVDMVTVANSVLCCLPGTDPARPRGRRFVLGAQRTVGPQGGCVGLEQRVTVALAGCGCPQEGAS